jgi:pimeloyl-ACP methyl ester carboxylesterase
MRGYNLSSRPADVAAYSTEVLAADVRGLITERGAGPAFLVGHDWGGAVAWATATNHPESVERLAILNCPHSRRMLQALRRPRQLARSWYMFLFQLPSLPERLLSAAGFRALRRAFREARPGAFTEQDMAHYVEAWSQPGAVAAMLNYYRASYRHRREAGERGGAVAARTLVIWGERDGHVGPELAEPDPSDVPNLDRVERLPDASHWVQHDEPERVGRLLIEFFGGGAGRQAAA